MGTLEATTAIVCRGLADEVTVRCDAHGIAHVRAANEHDAWFGQGFVAAQDRLWQMEYDRLRAAGRWAEAAGPAAVPGDILARRMDLAAAARADVAAMSQQTRAMFEAYAAGVNAFLRSGAPLPLEYQLTGIAPEPWEPWHSVALFKIRHVLMGVWQLKLCNARLLTMIGPEAYAKLQGGHSTTTLILPPGQRITKLMARANDEVRRSAEHLGFLAEVEAGSNSWAVHGSRTTTGKPVLCNDSHRALDVPNAYWQVHVAWPEFDVIGATFAGFPGFPHFGHNGRVAWNITHTQADYQDLYIEQFDQEGRYRTPTRWEQAGHRTERIAVRGAEDVKMEAWRTRHGPIVHGEPRDGMAIALRYTATDEPSRGFEALRPMLAANTVAELHESQRSWVDPVNNLVSADVDGNIGYMVRGRLPVRSSQAGRQFPVPGWTGEHEWTGSVPFDTLPRAINPPEGFIATANQRVIESDEPYIGHFFAPPSRTDRIVELLILHERMTPAQITAMQGDTTSIPARKWASLLARCGPFDGEAERARAMLGGWDGNLLPARPEGLLYAYFRREVARALFEPIAGERAWAWLNSDELPALGRILAHWLANVVARLDTDCADTEPNGRSWREVLPVALAKAWASATRTAGADPRAWRWDTLHGTRGRHNLSAAFPKRAAELDPPRAVVGGDSDTIQCAAFTWSGRADFNLSNTSVYRQAVDLADIDHAGYVIPGGASGVPGHPHYSDQLDLWRTHRRVPMHYREQDVAAATVTSLRLVPGR